MPTFLMYSTFSDENNSRCKAKTYCLSSIDNARLSHQEPTPVRLFVRATAVRLDMVLAGDPKVFRLLCNTNLNMNIPSRGSEEERIRILLWVCANIQSNRYNK